VHEYGVHAAQCRVRRFEAGFGHGSALVDLHEGSVEVRNCGPGAEFTVRLAAGASRNEDDDAGGEGEAPAMIATAESDEVTPAG